MKPETGRLVLDRARIAAKARVHGKYLLPISNQHLPAVEVASGYEDLLEAERRFRDVKSALLLRPVFNASKPHPSSCAHLRRALPLTHIAEQATGTPWAKIASEKNRIRSTRQCPADTVPQATEPADIRRPFVTAC
ncbi:MAG: hypothetical protein WCI74_03065 [Actinomycetes bacterium]